MGTTRTILTSGPLLALALLGGLPGGAGAAEGGHNTIGLGIAAVPVYEGSRDYRTLPVPLINYRSGSFFISPRAGLPSAGWYTTLAPHLSAGVFLGMSMGRDSDRAERSKGLDDIDFHGAYGVFLDWSPGPYSLAAAYRQATRSAYGGMLELRASATVWRNERHRVILGAGTQWANRDAMQTWFGVTPEDAGKSVAGLSVYRPSSGFKSAMLFGTWRYAFTRDWHAVATVGVNVLTGDARHSPLTERRANAFGNLGLTYAF